MNVSDQLESADIGNGGSLGWPSQEKSSGKGGRRRAYSVHIAMNQYQKQRSIGTVTILGLNGGQNMYRELEVSSDEDGRGHANALLIPMEGDRHSLNILNDMSC